MRHVFRVMLMSSLLMGRAHAQSGDSRAIAEQLFNQARELAKANQWAEACPKFEASLHYDPVLGTRLNLAMCYEHVGKLASAWGLYRESADLAKKVSDTNRRDYALKQATALELRLAKLEISVPGKPPAGLVVTRDGTVVDSDVLGVALYVDAGRHEVTASAQGFEPFTKTVTLVEGKAETVTIPDLIPTVIAPAMNKVGGENPELARDTVIGTTNSLTMSTYPLNELLRPLTKPMGIAQVRVGFGTDISVASRFGTFGLSIEAQYGINDKFTVISGLTDAYNFRQFGLYTGFERSILYNLLDIRIAANLHRSAIPIYYYYLDNYYTNYTAIFKGMYMEGGTKFSIDLGFPFRYAITPEIAIVALQTLMSIDFNATHDNGAAPDLNPSIGVAASPLPQLSLVAFTRLQSSDFDLDRAFQFPVTILIQFAPNRKFDIGLEFTLPRANPGDYYPSVDTRLLTLFVQSRIGK